jgi:hypothetical protein
MRKAMQLAGWTVQAQTRILRDRYVIATDWKHRAGIRGRSCAMLAS